jgi:hypothetical protein
VLLIPSLELVITYSRQQTQIEERFGKPFPVLLQLPDQCRLECALSHARNGSGVFIYGQF